MSLKLTTYNREAPVKRRLRYWLHRVAQGSLTNQAAELRRAVAQMATVQRNPDELEQLEQRLYGLYPQLRMFYDGMAPADDPFARPFVNRTDLTREISCRRRILYWMGLLHRFGTAVEIQVFKAMVMGTMKQPDVLRMDDLELTLKGDKARAPWPREMAV